MTTEEFIQRCGNARHDRTAWLSVIQQFWTQVVREDWTNKPAYYACLDQFEDWKETWLMEMPEPLRGECSLGPF